MDFHNTLKMLSSTLSSNAFVQQANAENFKKTSLVSTAYPEWNAHLTVASPLHILSNVNSELRTLTTDIQPASMMDLLNWQYLSGQVDVDYVKTLVAYLILEPEGLPNSQQLALEAASLYFLLLSIINADKFELYNQEVFIYAVKGLTKIPFNKPKETKLIIDFHNLIQKDNSIPERVLFVVLKSLVHCTRYKVMQEFREFDHLMQNISYVAFCTIKLFAKQLYAKGKDIQMELIFYIKKNFSLEDTQHLNAELANRILHVNTTLFMVNLPEILSKNHEALLVLAQMLTTDTTMDKHGVNYFLRHMPTEVLLSFRKWFAMKLCSKELNVRLQLLDYIPNQIYQDEHIPEAESFAYSKFLLITAIEFCCDPSEPMCSKSFKTLSNILGANDQYTNYIASCHFAQDNPEREIIFKPLSDFANNQDTMPSGQVKVLLTVLLNILDINPDWYSDLTTEWIKKFCQRLPSSDIRNTFTMLKVILYKYNDKLIVCKMFFDIWVPFVINPAPYAKAITSLISQVIFDTSDPARLANFAKVFVSSDYDVQEVFRKLREQQLLHPNSIRNMLDMELLRYPSIWLLIASCIPHVQFQTLLSLPERLQQCLDLVIKGVHQPQLVQIIFILNEMITTNPSLLDHPMHTHMMFQLNEKLHQMILEGKIYSPDLGAAVRFLSCLKKLYKEPNTWVFELMAKAESHFFGFMQNLLRALREEPGQTIVTPGESLNKSLTIMIELVSFHRLRLSEDNGNNLIVYVERPAEAHHLLPTFLTNAVDIWAQILILYSKIETIFPYRLEHNVATYVRLLDFPITSIVVLALDIFCDLCTYRLLHFEPLIPCLFKCLRNDCPLIRCKSVKLIMDLVNKDQLKFTDLQFYQYLCMLTDPSTLVRNQADECMSTVYIKKFESFVASQLVESIVHLNYCDKHPVFMLSMEDMDILQMFGLSLGDRIKIFHFIFSQLNPEIQLNVLESIAKQLIEPMVTSASIRKVNKFDRIELNVLSDALLIIMLVQGDKVKECEETKGSYQKFLKNLLASFTRSSKKFNKSEKSVLAHVKLVVTTLITMLLNHGKYFSKMKQELFSAIIIVTRKYKSVVCDIVSDGDVAVGKLYQDLYKYFQEHINDFDFENIEEDDLEEEISNNDHVKEEPVDYPIISTEIASLLV